MTWRAVSAASELSRKRRPSELPPRLYAATARLACDLLELGHALALLVDASLQLGDAGVELPGLVERIEVRVGDLVDLRLGVGDGLVRLGDGIGLLRERRQRGSSEEHSQHRADSHENGTAPVMHVQPSPTRGAARPRCIQNRTLRNDRNVTEWTR